ncbi:MAG: hypothetical protein OEU86_01120 [Gammaproteobacteria bacterium]|nr:hypothetical protein [Gammaproteobacteria bacterium]
MSYIRITVACLMIFAAVGCAEKGTEAQQLMPCTKPWNSYVETAVNTGDGQGHGPDPGSDEWRSVIEFKLGIRGNPDIPPRDSAAWCDYIDEQIN